MELHIGSTRICGEIFLSRLTVCFLSFNLFSVSVYLAKVAGGGQLHKLQSLKKKKQVIPDNLCSGLIIAGERKLLLFYIYPNSLLSTAYYFIGLFCKRNNFAFFSPRSVSSVPRGVFTHRAFQVSSIVFTSNNF